MKLCETAIQAVWVVETVSNVDARGAFARWFCQDAMQPAFGSRRIVQINHSRTQTVGTVRGLHFQRAPNAEMKLVRCIRGKVWDVAVDLRAGSSTFLAWHAEELSAENGRMMAVPEGCAHGFQTLDPETEILYLHTSSYAHAAEGGVRYDDPRLRIQWPLPVVGLSARDSSHPLLTDAFTGLL